MDTLKDWRSEEQRAADIAQAKALREQASQGGLKFEASLTRDLAVWVLDLVAKGVFTDPSHAVFEMLREQQELAKHPDLRLQILDRSLQKAREGPFYSAEEVEAEMEKWFSEAPQEPAMWVKQKYDPD